MYNPKSNKKTDTEIKPAPYADAAVTDEDVSSPGEQTEGENFEDDDLGAEADELEDNGSFENDDEIEELQIEDIEIEDIDDVDENIELEEDDPIE